MWRDAARELCGPCVLWVVSDVTMFTDVKPKPCNAAARGPIISREPGRALRLGDPDVPHSRITARPGPHSPRLGPIVDKDKQMMSTDSGVEIGFRWSSSQSIGSGSAATS